MTITRRAILNQTAYVSSLLALGTSCSPNPSSSDAIDQKSKPTASPHSIHEMDAVATASAIKNREITALEAIDAAIGRTQNINQHINALSLETFDEAREQAQNIDAKNLPLAGIPTFIKDLFDVTGLPTRHGSNSTKGHIAKAQSPFIDDFQNTGLISLGKSTTPEYGLTATTEPLSSGITRNPWNLDHSSGGSSGGAAALVAAGAVPMAHATDGGGSIRIPAACCGLVGLKPSRDRFRPGRDESKTPIRISAHGVVSRTMRDTAAFLAAMERPTSESSLGITGLISGPSKRRLKIGVANDTFIAGALHQDVKNAIASTSDLCSDLGHEVSTINPDIDISFADHFLLYWAAAAHGYVAKWEAENGRRANTSVFEPFTLGLQQHFLHNQEKMRDAIFQLLAFSGQWRKKFDEFDLIMSPVLSSPPVKIGYIGPEVHYDTALERLTNYAQFTAPANVAGTPSMSLPLSMSTNGLPIGVLFNAQAGDEKTLLELGYELEKARPWIARKPAVYAS